MSNDSTLARARNPVMCLRLEKESEKENQRTVCLERLVGLALHKEELGKNGQVVVNSLCTHLLVNLGDGGSSV